MKSLIFIWVSFTIFPKGSIADTHRIPRFLFYSGSDVMLSDFNRIPVGLRKEIESLKRGRKFGSTKLTKFLPELLSEFGLSKAKGVGHGEVVEFEFDDLKLTIHKNAESKEDCTTYPDVYLTMESKKLARLATKGMEDWKQRQTISPETNTQGVNDSWLIVPSDAKVLKGWSDVPQQIKKGISKVWNPEEHSENFFLHLGEVYFILPWQGGMGAEYGVIKCDKAAQCTKEKYVVDYPPCGT